MDRETRRVTLVDFGIATRLSQEAPIPADPSLDQGALAYISPEQTGRMNRVIDYRTDLYSLGVTLYEIQQPSNVTFRLDDWGRVDAAGMPRALHHDAGLPIVDPHSRPEPISPVKIAADQPDRELLVATRYFALVYEVPILGAQQHLKLAVAHMSAADEPATADLTVTAR